VRRGCVAWLYDAITQVVRGGVVVEHPTIRFHYIYVAINGSEHGNGELSYLGNLSW
jgi:hypothetical protein